MGPIVGGVMGGVAVLAVIAVGVTDWYQHRKASKQAKSTEHSPSPQPNENSPWIPDIHERLLSPPSPELSSDARHYVRTLTCVNSLSLR